MRESGWMERDKGSVNFHEGSDYLYETSPFNIYDQREGEKDNDDGKDNWGVGSFMMRLYRETLLTGIDGTV